MPYAASLRAALAPTSEPTAYPSVRLARLSAAQLWGLVNREHPDPAAQSVYRIASLLSLAAVGDDGARLFTADEVMELPVEVFDALGRRADELNDDPTPPPGPVIQPGAALAGLAPVTVGNLTVLLRRMTPADWRVGVAKFGTEKPSFPAAVWAVSRSVVDEQGGRLFTPEQAWGLDGGAVELLAGHVGRLMND